MTKAKILKIVKRKENYQYFLSRCLNTGTCPICGGYLTSESFDDGTDYNCNTCNSSYLKIK